MESLLPLKEATTSSAGHGREMAQPRLGELHHRPYCPLFAPKRICFHFPAPQISRQRPRRARIRLKRRAASFRRSSKLEKLVSSIPASRAT